MGQIAQQAQKAQSKMILEAYADMLASAGAGAWLEGRYEASVELDAAAEGALQDLESEL